MNRNEFSKQRGFTLVEVAIVLVIGGILLGALGSGVAAFIQNTRIQTTQERMDLIQDSIKSYISANGKLPCPARTNLPVTNVNFGKEAATGGPGNVSCTAAGGGITSASGGNVLIGSVPTRSLNLPDLTSLDAWNSRFTYAVSTDLADSSTPFDPSNAAISIVDAGGNSVITPAGEGHYVIISHGQDQTGSITLNGSVLTACPGAGATLDEENCNGDATFISTTQNSNVTGANFYDDYAVFFASEGTTAAGIDNIIPDGAIMAFNLATCPQGWGDAPNSAGRMIIGAGPSTDPGNGSASFSIGDPPGGEEFVTLREEEMPRHSHNIPYDDFNNRDLSALPAGGSNVLTNNGTTETTIEGNDEAHNNLPPYVVFKYCIKN